MSKKNKRKLKIIQDERGVQYAIDTINELVDSQEIYIINYQVLNDALGKVLIFYEAM